MWHVKNAKSRFMLPMHSLGAHGAMVRGFRMKESARAEFGESACTGRVLAQLMLPRSDCVHALRALYFPQIGGSDAHTCIAHD